MGGFGDQTCIQADAEVGIADICQLLAVIGHVRERLQSDNHMEYITPYVERVLRFQNALRVVGAYLGALVTLGKLTLLTRLNSRPFFHAVLSLALLLI